MKQECIRLAQNEAVLDEKYDELLEYLKQNGGKNSMFIAIAFEELFVNVVNYAYGNAKGPIAVEICNNDDTISITFVDFGTPFDPVAYADWFGYADSPVSIGGKGLKIIRQVSMDMKYQRVLSMNITNAKFSKKNDKEMCDDR